MGSLLSLYPLDDDVLRFYILELEWYRESALNLFHRNIWSKDASSYENTSYRPTNLKRHREHSSSLEYIERYPAFPSKQHRELEQVTVEAILKRAWENEVREPVG